MECEENTSDNDIDDSGERKTQKPKSQTDPQDEAKLVTKLWIAGLASTYGSGGVPTPLAKKLTTKVHTTKLPQLQLSPPSPEADVNHQLADIDEAVRLVRAQTLASGDGRGGVSLNELSTVMLGLCRLVAENAKQLVVSARETEDELLMQVDDGDDAQLSKMKKGGKRKEVEESATLPVRGQRNKRLKIDEVIQLPRGEEEISEDEEEDAEGERMLPDFGLPTKLAMKESKCRGCVSPGDQLPLNAGRQLSEKVAYLYERKCRSIGSSRLLKKKTALRSYDRRSRRSMTCDSGRGKVRARVSDAHQPGEHYDVDKVREADKKRQSASESSLPFSSEDEEEEEEMTVNLVLYDGSKRKGSVEQSGNDCSNKYMSCLPPRWRHMMMPRSGGISSAARVAADSTLPQQLSQTASFRRSIRTAYTGTSRPTTGALIDFSARDRASIKSIIYAPDLRLTQPFCWQYQYQSPGPRAPFLRERLSTSHDALGHVNKHEKGSLDVLQQRLIAILSRRSSRATLPLYEFDHLVRAAVDASDELRESKPLSKQVLATHFVALLHLPLGTVNLRQKAPGGRRRPGLRLADFTSPTATRKIYVSLIEEKPQELQLPFQQSPPISLELESNV